MAHLSLTNVGKTYGGSAQAAVADVDIEIRDGEVVSDGGATPAATTASAPAPVALSPPIVVPGGAAPAGA